jgi:hypothetical protein
MDKNFHLSDLRYKCLTFNFRALLLSSLPCLKYKTHFKKKFPFMLPILEAMPMLEKKHRK